MCFVCSICTHTGKPNLRRLLLTWQASLLGCKLGSANDKQYLPSKHGNLLSLPRGFLCWLSHPLLQTKEYSLRFLAVGEVNEPIWPRRGKSMNFGISFPVFRVTAPGLQIYYNQCGFLWLLFFGWHDLLWQLPDQRLPQLSFWSLPTILLLFLIFFYEICTFSYHRPSGVPSEIVHVIFSVLKTQPLFQTKLLCLSCPRRELRCWTLRFGAATESCTVRLRKNLKDAWHYFD